MMRYVYTVTYSIMLMTAVFWGFVSTTSESIPVISRIIEAFVGVGGVIQIVLNIKGYKLVGKHIS